MWAGAGGPRPWGWPIQQAAFANVPHEQSWHHIRWFSIKSYLPLNLSSFIYSRLGVTCKAVDSAKTTYS